MLVTKHNIEHLGDIYIGSKNNKLCFIKDEYSSACLNNISEFNLLVANSICSYLEGKTVCFDFEIELFGSEFQLKVWKAIQKIPYGEKTSYQQIAKNINKPKSYRAVANAVGRNPIPIVIPCHRVIRSDGKLGGYSFFKSIEGLKSKLLVIENNQCIINDK